MEEKMKFSLDLLENDSDIIKLILENLKNQMDNVMNKALSKITIEIKNLVKEALISEPEYSSLKAGTLRAEFGILNTGEVDGVVDAMVNTLEISNNPIKVSGRGLSGGFTLSMIRSSDINGIIGMDIAMTKTEKGESLPWLEWLLLKGNDKIIQDYSITYINNSYRSRTGSAIMVSNPNGWRVPVNFAGTEDNNWTTRAINKISDKISKVIQTNIEDLL